MQKIKKAILISVIFGCLFFLFGPEIVPTDFQPEEILNIAADNDVIIIFNSGGWGDTPMEKAEDFYPIIEGIQQTLSDWGYQSIVIPYSRTKNTFWGKISSAREFFSFFDFSSGVLARELESMVEDSPDKKIIIAGLSNGAVFTTETYNKISNEVKDSFCVLSVGSPFWYQTYPSEDILQLKSRADTLVRGEPKVLFSSLFKAPGRWLTAKLEGRNLTLGQALETPGHIYAWSSPEVRSEIVGFLENKLR